METDCLKAALATVRAAQRQHAKNPFTYAEIQRLLNNTCTDLAEAIARLESDKTLGIYY